MSARLRRLQRRDLRPGGGRRGGRKLVRCAGACERERHRPGQPAEAGGLRLEQGGVEARDDDECRPCRLGRVGECSDRRVRAEKEDPPGVRAQHEREREQGDVVHLAGCAGESKRARSAAPEPGKRKQPAADEVAREVLLADLDLAPLPAVADLLQDGQHHLAQRLLQAERSKALVEHRVSGGLVVAADRREQAGGQSSSIPSDGRSSSSAARAASAAERPCVEPAPHPLHASGVGRRVEPEAARRANRPREPVPGLPRAQQLGRDAHPARELADPKLAGIRRIEVTIQTLNKHLTQTLGSLPYKH